MSHGTSPTAVRARWTKISDVYVAAWLICLTLIGFVLRVAFAVHSGLWRDEAQFLWIVRSPTVESMLDFLRTSESHPPLLYVLMRGWLALFGDTEAVALSLCIAFGVVLIPISYRISAEVFSQRAALIAALLIALSPSLTWHAAMVRPYSLLPLLCAVSAFFLWRGLARGGCGAWAAYCVATLALLLTHHWAWLVLAAEWGVTILSLILFRGRSAVVVTREWLLVQCALLVAYTPWLSALVYQVAHAGHGPMQINSLVGLSKVFSAFVKAGLSLPDSFSGARSLPLLVFVVAVFYFGLGRRKVGRQDAYCEGGEPKDRTLGLLVFLGVPVLAYAAAVVLSMRNSLLVPHSLVTVSPCVLLAVSHALSRLSPLQAGHPRATQIATGVLVTCFVGVLLFSYGRVKSNAREVAAAVASRTHPTDLLMITPEFLASSFNYYYGLQNPQIAYLYEGRRHAISYSARSEEPETSALARIKERLTRACRNGQRTWLIMERDALTNDVDHAYKVSNDLRRFLTHLYGPPDVTLVPADTRNGAEILVALLYGEAHPTRYSLLLPASRNDTGSRAVGQRIATDAISKDNPLLD